MSIADDPIVDEVRRVRQEHEVAFGLDLRRIADDLRQSQKSRGRPVVTGSPRRIEPDPSRNDIARHRSSR